MSKQLLKKSLSLMSVEDNICIKKSKESLHKGNKREKLLKNNGKTSAKHKKESKKSGIEEKKSKNINIFKVLRKNGLESDLIKDIVVSNHKKRTKNVSTKSQSVFTDKDFEDFVKNYE